MPIVAAAFLASSSSAFLKLDAAPAVSPPPSCWPPRLAKNSAFFSGATPSDGASSGAYGSLGPSVGLGVAAAAGGGGAVVPDGDDGRLGPRRVGSEPRIG